MGRVNDAKMLKRRCESDSCEYKEIDYERMYKRYRIYGCEDMDVEMLDEDEEVEVESEVAEESEVESEVEAEVAEAEIVEKDVEMLDVEKVEEVEVCGGRASPEGSEYVEESESESDESLSELVWYGVVGARKPRGRKVEVNEE